MQTHRELEAEITGWPPATTVRLAAASAMVSCLPTTGGEQSACGAPSPTSTEKLDVQQVVPVDAISSLLPPGARKAGEPALWLPRGRLRRSSSAMS